ncbi:hypothetical protein G6F57_022382 [Rhizopus arrhizus]|nr:hypothetical protein G6F35_016468 [Rhizopus arrhizus]KAG1433142.1 hypothetical protein G6F57_022382 [Rhizopus arrhizus]
MGVGFQQPLGGQPRLAHKSRHGVRAGGAAAPGFGVVVQHRIDDGAGAAVVHDVGDGLRAAQGAGQRRPLAAAVPTGAERTQRK